MFKIIRLLKFWGPILLMVGFILGLLFILSLITELHAYQISLTGVWPLCLLLDPSCPPANLDFWPFVLLNMAPSLVAVVVACWLAASFVQALYGLKSKREGWEFLVRSRFGLSGLKPLLIIKEGGIQGGENHVLRRVGGPGALLIFNDSAVVLERAGRLTRVLGPGFYYLEPFEKIWDVVDLRPQRWELKVEAMTQEGIPVDCWADVSFKIDDEGQESTREVPYPMSEEAVFKATTGKWIREADRTEPDRLMTWTKRVIIGETEGTLRSILARYPLDRLIEADSRRAIQQELEKALRESVPALGVKITRVALGDIKVKDEVTQQWIEKWQAEGRRRMMELEAKGRAERIRLEAEARFQAQAAMITNTIETFATMVKKYGQEVPSRFIILRFIDMIKRTSAELMGRLYLPYEMMRAMATLELKLKGAGEGDTKTKDKKT